MEKVTIMMDGKFLKWWGQRPPHIKDDQTIMIIAHQAWEASKEAREEDHG